MPQSKTPYYFQASFKQIQEFSEKSDGARYGDGVKIRGYASTADEDRGNDIVLPEAFRKSIQKDYKNNPIILFQHNTNRPIGKAVSMQIDQKGLFIEAIVYDEEIAMKVDKEVLRTFSIGYYPIVIEYRDADTDQVLDPENDRDFMRIWMGDNVKRIIKELELLEISVVSIPMNQNALFSLSKSLKSFFTDKKEEVLASKPSINPKAMNKKSQNLLESKEDEQEQEAEKETEQEETTENSDSEANEGSESESNDAAENEGEKPSAESESSEGGDGEKPAESEAGEKSDDEEEDEDADGEDEEEETESEEGGEAKPDVSEEAEKAGIDPRLVTPKNMKMALESVKTLKAKNVELEEKCAKLQKELDSTPTKRATLFGTKMDSKVPEAPSQEKKEDDAKKNEKNKVGFKDAFLKAAN